VAERYRRGDRRTTEPEVPGVTPWIYVQEGKDLYIRHADVSHEAVRRYLDLVDQYGDGLEWTIVTNQRGRKNAVAYGPNRERVTPFYLYLALKGVNA
jgi:hypothetical protein